MSSEIERSKVHCIMCGRKTNHDVLHEITQRDSTPDDEIHWWETFQIIQCRGCDSVTFRKLSGSSEDFDEDGPVISQQLYPGRTAGKGPIKGSEWFPYTTDRMYREVLQALNNDAPVLAAIGLRALIESICIEQDAASKDLIGCIDELADMGLLAKYQAEFLHAHRFLGNVAAHEMKAPKPEELNAALDIAETLLKTIYVLPHVAATIRTGKKKPSTP
ncbi:MAG TPA: DUF4145 domain-containing protein [Chloroflexia bacterium]|jgi:hypothetical protein